MTTTTKFKTTYEEVKFVIDQVDGLVTYLKERWLDEKEYEAFEPYIEQIQKAFKQLGYDNISVNKNFKISFISKLNGKRIEITRRMKDWKIREFVK